jgi:hypothetical protein
MYGMLGSRASTSLASTRKEAKGKTRLVFALACLVTQDFQFLLAPVGELIRLTSAGKIALPSKASRWGIQAGP